MDITAALTSMAALQGPLRTALSAIAVLAGIFLFATAGRALIKGGRGQDEGPNLPAIGISMFVGAALVQFSRSITDTSSGLLAGAGSEVRTMMTSAIGAGTGGPFWTLLMSTCLVWIATIGAVGMFRGFLLWNKAGSGDSQGGQGDYFWRGLWHIIGGAICINIGS